MMFSKHTRRLGLAVAVSLGASAAAAQGCDSVQTCWASAKLSQIADITPVVEGEEGCKDRDGCLKVNGGPRPYGPGLWTDDDHYSYPVIAADPRTIEPMAVILPKDLDPNRGATIMVHFPIHRGTSLVAESLFSIVDEQGFALISLGFEDGALVYGRQGWKPNATSRRLQGWIPVWDPDVFQWHRSAMLILRLEPTGKVRIDVVWLDDETDTMQWSANLMDVGWPIVDFPDQHGKKTFIKPAGLTIGGTPWEGMDTDPMATGVAQILVYDRPLTNPEMLAVSQVVSGAGIFSEDLNAEPCNTGAYLSALKVEPTKTLCGDRWSSLAAISPPREFTVRSGAQYWGHAGIGQPVPLTDAKDAAVFTAISPSGRNDFILKYAGTDKVLEADNQQVVVVQSVTKPLASQYWHMFYGSRVYPQTMMFRALGNGLTLGSTSTALELNAAGQGWTINSRSGALLEPRALPSPSTREPDDEAGR